MNFVRIFGVRGRLHHEDYENSFWPDLDSESYWTFYLFMTFFSVDVVNFFFWIFYVNVCQITSISENVAHDDRLISWRTEPVERVMINVHVGIWMKRYVSRILEGKRPFETPSQPYQFHGHAHLALLNFWWLGDKHWNANGNCTHAHRCTQAFCWQHDIKYQRIVSYGNREPGDSKHFLRIQYYLSDRKANEEKSIQLNILGAIN